MTAPPLMPAAFIGHGSPMNALETNRYTASWRAFGQAVPQPRAILAISAHWYLNATAVTAMPQPRTIHDFYGFPQPLFDVAYPAPGMPELVGEISDLVHPTWIGADVDSWGIDHGTWSVLLHAMPHATVPVVQLSLNAEKAAGYHLQLGARLAPLRAQGILIVGSGNIVHNLGALDRAMPDTGYDWAIRFDQDARERMLTDPSELASLDAHPDYSRAVPTTDPFLPALYVAGLAAAAVATSEPQVLIDGCVGGSLSMASYTLGLPPLTSLDKAVDDNQPTDQPIDLPTDGRNA